MNKSAPVAIEHAQQNDNRKQNVDRVYCHVELKIPMSIADFQLPIVTFFCFSPIDNRQLKIGNSNDPFGRTRNPKVCSSKSAIANEFLDLVSAKQVLLL